MKLLSLVVLLCISSATLADRYTLYLIRHAEKDLQTKVDPDLTLAGRETAMRLKEHLKNIALEKVYSTDYRRTRYTAQPIANHKQLDITIYDPRDLAQFASQLLAEQKDALIVGHSNTTPELVRLIGGKADDMSEDEYGDLFIVTVDTESKRVTTSKINL